MSERGETRDFMTVDSFSQLPFIRPSKKPSTSPTSVRLFGFEFPPELNSNPKEPASPARETNTANSATTADTAAAAGPAEAGRKFECHYCCRNFPTSQALGGHQNAHKRERQHAKRAYLQSAMAAAHAQHHVPIAEGHVYGILNYHRLGSGLTGGPPPHYPSWGGGPRFYGGPGSVSQPINGSPLPGLWKVCSSTATGMMVHQDRNRSRMSPLVGSGIEARPVIGVAGSASSSSSTSSSSSAKDHGVSLDLSL